jgi:hypothetical protein
MDPSPQTIVRGAGFPPATVEAILSRNAERLFDLPFMSQRS